MYVYMCIYIYIVTTFLMELRVKKSDFQYKLASEEKKFCYLKTIAKVKIEFFSLRIKRCMIT